MPAIYRIESSDDEGQNRSDSSAAGMVTFDATKTGKLTSGEYQALLVGDEIKPLPHPLESSTLKAHNQSYFSASFRGRLLQVQRRVCLDCGYIFDVPKIVFSSGAGCMPGFVGSLTTFLFLRFGASMPTDTSLLISGAVLLFVPLLFQFAGTLYIRRRFSARQESIKQLECPFCKKDKSIRVADLAGKRVQIGCEGKWVQVSVAGRS